MGQDTSRICKICNEALPVIEFRWLKRRSDGRHMICIDCETELDEKTDVKNALLALKQADIDRNQKAINPASERESIDNVAVRAKHFIISLESAREHATALKSKYENNKKGIYYSNFDKQVSFLTDAITVTKNFFEKVNK
jgi:hypothetical protein